MVQGHYSTSCPEDPSEGAFGAWGAADGVLREVLPRKTLPSLPLLSWEEN